MTTHTRAAPGRSFGFRWLHLIALSTAVALGGCESGASLFGSDASSQPETQVAQPAPPPAANLPRVAIAPVIGAPDTVGKQLAQDMSSAIGQQKVTVVPATGAVDHTIRGYVVAARDRTGVKVSYIWDVTDPQGRRTNRITGEEIVANGNPKDPWSSVSASVSQSIAQKAASSFGSWIATQAPPAPAAQPAVAAAPAAAQPIATPAIASATTTPPATKAALAAPTTTASIRSNATAVPNLVGAPGDGNSALAEALKAQLSKSGVSMTSQSASSYRVEGVVTMSAAAAGNQAIQIDWNVRDPEGKKLGTVTQKNDIPSGSLDGKWGQTADAAAEAAAQGILKLLPKSGTN